jgi:hypothetical protein
VVVDCNDVKRFVAKLRFVVRVLNELADQELIDEKEYGKLLEDLVTRLVALRFTEPVVGRDKWGDLCMHLKCTMGDIEVYANVRLAHDELWERVVEVEFSSEEEGEEQ